MNRIKHSINPLLPGTAVLKEISAETSDVFSLKMTTDEDFLFEPGQFNMLGLPGFGEAPISFSSLPLKKNFIHTIRVVGNVTQALCSLKAGDSLQLRGPFGNSWPLELALHKNLIIVAGGIGMAPLRPVVHFVQQNRKKFGRVFLIYGSKRSEDMLFTKEVEEWCSSDQITSFFCLERKSKKMPFPLSEGLVTSLLRNIDVPLKDAVTFTCGPDIMMHFVAEDLIRIGHKSRNIFVSMERRMKCGFGHCGHCQMGAKFICKDGPVFAYSEVRHMMHGQI
ncbi:MAG: FAD/NAD(P)-binding protein [Candidatus Wallbacteria bacterium]|nr:FAD/NAD(P)-binding protein [Candidatus Wallbacteria bacterium]